MTKYTSILGEMQGLGGATADQVKVYDKFVMDLAGKVGKGPVELADAMKTITSLGGITQSDAIETLQISAKAAAAGLGDTKSVADAATSAMSAYGFANLSATEAVDTLTAAVRVGKAEASTFAPVMGQVLPLANELGVTFGDAAGGIAFLTKATGSASLAATGLRGILTQLIRPTEAVQKLFKENAKLKELGFSTEGIRSSIKEKGLHETLMWIKTGFEQAGVPVTEMFSDIEGLNALLQMTGVNAASAAKDMMDVTNSAGSVDAAFKAVENTPGFKMNQALALMKVQLLKLGDILAPIMTKMVSWSGIFMGFWDKLSTGVKKFIVYLAAIAAMIGPVLVMAGGFISGIGAIFSVVVGVITTIISVVATVIGAVGALLAPMTLITGIVTAIGTVIGSVISILAAMFSPVVLLTAAIVALGVYAIYYFDVWGKVVKWFGEQWASLLQWIQPAIDGIKVALQANDLTLAVKILWAQIELGWVQGIAPLKEAWQGFKGWFENSIIDIGKTGGGLLLKMQSWLTGEDMSAQLGVLETTSQLMKGMVEDETAKSMNDIQAEIKAMQDERDKLVTEAKKSGVPITGPEGTAAPTAGGPLDIPKITVPKVTLTATKVEGIQGASSGSAEAQARILAFRSTAGDTPESRTANAVEETRDILRDMYQSGSVITPIRLIG